MITRVNIEELLGILADMGLVLSGLWFGFPGPLFRHFMHRASHARRETS